MQNSFEECINHQKNNSLEEQLIHQKNSLEHFIMVLQENGIPLALKMLTYVFKDIDFQWDFNGKLSH